GGAAAGWAPPRPPPPRRPRPTGSSSVAGGGGGVAPRAAWTPAGDFTDTSSAVTPGPTRTTAPLPLSSPEPVGCTYTAVTPRAGTARSGPSATILPSRTTIVPTKSPASVCVRIRPPTSASGRGSGTGTAARSDHAEAKDKASTTAHNRLIRHRSELGGSRELDH